MNNARGASPGRASTPELKREVLALLAEAWEQQPEMRLGQLLTSWAQLSLADGDTGYTGSKAALSALFYIEDGDLAHSLRLWAVKQREIIEEKSGTDG
jgi:uncharacterized protein YihD (DUF1040 family)